MAKGKGKSDKKTATKSLKEKRAEKVNKRNEKSGVGKVTV
jgi:hypothetical protein